MAHIRTKYDMKLFKGDVEDVCFQVSEKLTPAIMRSADKYIDKVLKGIVIWVKVWINFDSKRVLVIN